jgi:dUTP pyrophosphatase
MVRKFAVVSKYQNQGIELPQRQTIHSAGYDLASALDYKVEAHQIVLVSTGLKVYLDEKEVLLIVSRSSLPKKMGLIIPNSVGVIDADYVDNPSNEGELFIQVYNITDNPCIIKKGDRLAQGIFTTFLTTTPDNVSDNLRQGGFGSSDKVKK